MGGIIPSLLLPGEFSEEDWDRTMGDEALGPVCPSAPIAAKLVRDIKGRIDDIYFETFEDYFTSLNIVRMKRPAKDKKWISAIRKAIQTKRLALMNLLSL